MAHFENLTGRVFGRLRVLHRVTNRPRLTWRCQCVCEAIKDVAAHHLKSGKIQSCGCYNKERIKQSNTKHGACRRGVKSRGDMRHPLYVIWTNMKQRCYDVKSLHYKDYGGRGIDVFTGWHDYIPFRDYMLSSPNCPEDVETPGTVLDMTIDRIRNNEGYKPGNVRWALGSVQNSNRRNVMVISVNGVKLPFPDAARRYGKAHPDVIRRRIKNGWSHRDAFLTPSRLA